MKFNFSFNRSWTVATIDEEMMAPFVPCSGLCNLWPRFGAAIVICSNAHLLLDRLPMEPSHFHIFYGNKRTELPDGLHCNGIWRPLVLKYNSSVSFYKTLSDVEVIEKDYAIHVSTKAYSKRIVKPWMLYFIFFGHQRNRTLNERFVIPPKANV